MLPRRSVSHNEMAVIHALFDNNVKYFKRCRLFQEVPLLDCHPDELET
jgi:hypothetical protein